MALLALTSAVAQKPAAFEVVSLKIQEGPIQRMGAGSAGEYDVELEATPESQMGGDDPDNETLSVFTAVREQLGLSLEKRKVITEILVVDAAHKPTVN